MRVIALATACLLSTLVSAEEQMANFKLFTQKNFQGNATAITIGLSLSNQCACFRLAFAQLDDKLASANWTTTMAGNATFYRNAPCNGTSVTFDLATKRFPSEFCSYGLTNDVSAFKICPLFTFPMRVIALATACLLPTLVSAEEQMTNFKLFAQKNFQGNATAIGIGLSLSNQCVCFRLAFAQLDDKLASANWTTNMAGNATFYRNGPCNGTSVTFDLATKRFPSEFCSYGLTNDVSAFKICRK
ncbi:hypothetical protein GQ42DRAFT_176981 [Ramicandelaber brevisporus]|nr:hypothetical protein GQ42DRAFT_176981 [Ramicandelaber brevisporus]